ncbi:ammonium transporter [Nocardia uniformis]|uniref:Ammonium transporter n=1 Tax=Nocardia uniformis TaxID=53432 RepID=A0A849CDM6_9NOCA|nr:ammonium transporter [Nocardia uniformis]NNH73259.1 ammonium transporter [Nocardia uniformis]
MPPTLDAAATAWLLASTALVLLMTPGLAIFYGGMVRSSGVLNMLMMSFISIPLVTVAWLLIGYSLAFGADAGGGLIGNLDHLGLSGFDPMTVRVTDAEANTGIPDLLFVTFQLTFAILTVALVSGAIADRAKFSAWMVFVPVWAIVVYAPIAHWVWNSEGWLAKFGALDYAGGLVVEIASGASALALALVLGPRVGFKVDAMRPHNLPFVLLGAGLLWFGWFGFNAGSALAADGTAAAVFLNTLVAGCLGMLGWLAVEQVRDGRPTTFGAASGVVAGLVAITPSCGYVNTVGALIVGLLAGMVCSFAVGWKFKAGYDDSLDVVGVHFVGGVVGTALIGLLATQWMTGPDGAEGLFYGGGLGQLGKQTVGILAVAAWAFGLSYLVGKVIDKIIGFRVSREDEVGGIDFALHAETAYAEGVHGHAVRRINEGPLGH